jgi:hypothetical protein
MTVAVCMVCASKKFGAWTRCQSCDFAPRTILDLTLSLEYSDRGSYRSRLDALSGALRKNIEVLEHGGDFKLDELIIDSVSAHIDDPSWRDSITLKRTAKDSFLTKRLNVHETGTDGYSSYVLERGKNIDKDKFDAIRRTGDGDLYLAVFYVNGERTAKAVKKSQWYALFDKMILAERSFSSRSVMQEFHDGTCEILIDRYLKSGRVD